MCGIVGVLSKKGENIIPLIESMLTSIAYRGPDGAGIATSSRIVFSDSVAGLSKGMKLSSDAALGHVRLAIVGGTGGQQPFRSCNRRFTLEHNGEIYNYKKLRDRLRKKHDFVTDTDSEVIVHMVEDHFDKTRNLLLVYNIYIRDIAYRSKEAAQHGSGIHQVIDLIARKHGFDESTISAKYLDVLKSRERIGSSQRYGYLFENEKKKMWIAEPHVQMYLDSICKVLLPTTLEQNVVAKRKSHL